MGPRRRWLPATLLAGVVVFALGLALGRATSGAPAPSPPPPVQQDTAETGAPVLTGPSDTGIGVPTGYARTPEDAVAAATAYGLALDGPTVLDPAHRAAVLDAIAAQTARDDLTEVFDRAATLISSRLQLDAHMTDDPGFVWRAIPAGWQLRSYDGDTARVAIWAAVMALAGDRPLVAPGWRTSEVTLVWEREDWKLVGFRTEPGPSPTLLAEPEGVSVGRRINTFEPFRHVPQLRSPRR